MVKRFVLQIGAFEKASGLTRTTVRYYERCGLLKPELASKGGSYRHYGREHVERAKMIRLAQSLGFSIKEILRLLRAWESGMMKAEDQSRELKAKRAEINDKKNSLLIMEQYINAKIEWLDGGEKGPRPELGS